MSYYYYGNDDGRKRGFFASLPPVTKNLIIINVIIFLATLTTKGCTINTSTIEITNGRIMPTSQSLHPRSIK